MAKDTTTTVENFRPKEADSFMPEPGSALEQVTEQSRGGTEDERSKNDIRKHDHDGVNSMRVNIHDLTGFIQTVSTAPTWTPKNFWEQFAIYRSGATLRLYCYDTTNNAWRFAVLA